MFYDVRSMTAADAPPLYEMINQIIRAGGTTAYETEFSLDGFSAEFLTAPDVMASHVALHDGVRVGFQTLFRLPDTPNLAIGSFTDRSGRYKGVGQALFTATEAAARRHGAAYIRATIRADNALGRRYYRGLGFKDVAVASKPLASGRMVDRIETRLVLSE